MNFPRFENKVSQKKFIIPSIFIDMCRFAQTSRIYNFQFLNSKYTVKQSPRSHETAAPTKTGKSSKGLR